MDELERRRAGILKVKKGGMRANPTSNADSSSISSISTQASVYAPTFNPTTKPTSDWYDSINDSDTSTIGPNGGLRSDVGTDGIGERRPPPPTNLTPVHMENSISVDPTLAPPSSSHSRRFPSSDDLVSVQGYLSDASSTSSFMRPRLKPRLNSHMSTESELPTPHSHKSSVVVTRLSFKERNFNFDFENESLTSTMGLPAFEDLCRAPSRPPQPHTDTSLSISHTPTSTHTSIPHSNSNINEGLIANQKLPSTKTPGVGAKALETIQDINTPVSSSNAMSHRHSSISSSSLMSKSTLEFSLSKRMEASAQTPLEQSNEFSSEGTPSDSGEGHGGSFDKTLKNGTRGTFLLCIPKGICMLDGNVRSGVPRLMADNSTISVNTYVKSLWADAYQPTSFDEFLCHVQQAEFLRQLISQGNCPHLFFHGASTYGKNLLIKVLLREIFGPSSWKVSRERREFKKKGEKKAIKELLASKFHVELDAEGLGESARAILVGLCKEIAQSMETSRVIVQGENYETNFRVIVLYRIEKLSNDTQQLLRWLMDRYGDTCKLLLCSNHASSVLDSVKARCQNLGVDSPSEQEIINFLQYIARKENLRVSLDFIKHIAHESNQNLRHAIESLEALKPTRQGQAIKEELPIPTGWEDTVVEVANEILLEQTPKRMYITRQKLHSLLLKQVSSHLILQSMVLELLKNVDNALIQEVCYWHGIYNKRLSSSSIGIDKLEEFVARIMSIYKKYKKTNLVDYK